MAKIEIFVTCPAEQEDRVLATLKSLCGVPTHGPLFLNQNKPDGYRIWFFQTEQTLTWEEKVDLSLLVVGEHLDEIAIGMSWDNGTLSYPNRWL